MYYPDVRLAHGAGTATAEECGARHARRRGRRAAAPLHLPEPIARPCEGRSVGVNDAAHVDDHEPHGASAAP